MAPHGVATCPPQHTPGQRYYLCVVLNCETTGLDVEGGSILELAACVLGTTHCFTAVVDPERPFTPPGGVHDITMDVVKANGSEPFRDTFVRFSLWVGRMRIFAMRKDGTDILPEVEIWGHNVVDFDIPFLQMELSRSYSYPAWEEFVRDHSVVKLVDTLGLFRHAFRPHRAVEFGFDHAMELRRFNLPSLVANFLPVAARERNTHRARRGASLLCSVLESAACLDGGWTRFHAHRAAVASFVP